MAGKKEELQDEVLSEEAVEEVAEKVEEKAEETKEGKKTSRKRSKKSKKEDEPLPEDFTGCFDELVEVEKTIVKLISRAKKLTTEIKKKHNKELKENKKRRKRKSPSDGPRPQAVQDDFAKLFGITKPITRAEGVKIVNDYIREKKLQDPNEKRYVIPDKDMRKLFDLKPKERFMYNGIPGLISKFFIPNNPPQKK